MKCALIGTSKFAEIHFEQLVKNKVKEITIVTRDLKKGRNLIKKLKIIYPKTLILTDKIEILKKKKFDIIDICSTNDVHHKHLEQVSKLKSIIIIEKPLISLLKIKKYKAFIKKLYANNRKVFVLYQMLYLSKIFKINYKKKQKIKFFKFHFSTGGKHQGKNICIDLMPHALTFIMGYIHINSFNKKIKIKKVFFNKNKWISRFIYENINFDIILEEKIGNNTFLSVQINEDKIERFTEILNGKFINYLIYKNKKIKIKNPISEVFKNLFKNIKNNNFYLRNRIQTISLLDTNYKMLF